MGKTRTAARFVAPIFKENNWVWSDNKVPDEEEIYNTLKDLKKDAKGCKGWACTGRLMAHYDHDFKSVEYLLCIPEKEGA